MAEQGNEVSEGIHPSTLSFSDLRGNLNLTGIADVSKLTIDAAPAPQPQAPIVSADGIVAFDITAKFHAAASSELPPLICCCSHDGPD